jgi:anti-anti-sigma regulatory factor
LEYTMTQIPGAKLIALMGMINEDADFVFQQIQPEIKDEKKIVFNFSQIKSINSLGVRAWVSFLRSIEDNKEIIFSECTPDVIMQINMIPSFLGKAKVESFFVNYICDICSKGEKKLLFTKDITSKSIPPPPVCGAEDCGIQTEELEEEYFVFLTR